MAKKKKSKTKAKPAEEKQKEEEEIVQPDRASLGILADVVDHHVELIFAERSNRLERWVTLNVSTITISLYLESSDTVFRYLT